MRVILLNGPARSGKDSLATAFANHAAKRGKVSEIVKFAGSLKDSAHRLFGFVNVMHDHFEAEKDKPQHYLHGKTWRQIYIAVSELLFKPTFGADIFGRLTRDEMNVLREVNRMDGDPPVDFWLVSDSGFAPEARVLVDSFGVENIILVRLERDGYSFAGDSRGYIALPGVTPIIMNLGDKLAKLDECAAELFDLVKEVRS